MLDPTQSPGSSPVGCAVYAARLYSTTPAPRTATSATMPTPGSLPFTQPRSQSAATPASAKAMGRSYDEAAKHAFLSRQANSDNCYGQKDEKRPVGIFAPSPGRRRAAQSRLAVP